MVISYLVVFAGEDLLVSEFLCILSDVLPHAGGLRSGP